MQKQTANGTLILVLGILGLVMCGPFTGIPAWLMGNNSLKMIDQGLADPSERGTVSAGRILGIISSALFLIGACVWVGMIVLAIGAGSVGR